MTKTPENKADLVEHIALNADLSKAAATRALNSFLDGLTLTLRSGNSVSLLGFGTFSVKARAARAGRNPKTGEPIQIEATIIPSFKAGKSLKDAVNSGSIVAEAEAVETTEA